MPKQRKERARSRESGRPSRSLKDYRRKRNLKKSGEPSGVSARRDVLPQFVVQKHDATSLHYDFRLEAEGVLKSWAVPKGLPVRVGAKSLAIEVEDHPLDYGGFEGTIPEGNYGAGTVMLWDRGPYALEGGDFAKAHRAGKLHVALAGSKLRGEWTLVRMPARDGDKKNNWLVIRNRTSSRRPKHPKARTVPRGESVLTGRTMKEIEEGRNRASSRRRARK